MNVIANFILFQIGWFASVLGAAKGYPWLGVWVCIAIMLIFIFASARQIHALKMVGVASVIGLIFDAIPVYFDWVEFPAMSYWSTALAPAWMLVLWGNLATTLNSSLAWLKNKIVLASIFGAIGGPLAYIAGAELGAFKIVEFGQMITYLATGWGLLMPLMFYFNRHKLGFSDTKFAETGVS